MTILLAAGFRVGRVEVGLLPEGLRQPGEPERSIEPLGLLGDELPGLPFEGGVHVDPFDQAGPVLTPSVGEPVGGQLAVARGLGLVALRQDVPGPGVELLVDRLGLGDQAVAQRHHLGDGHAVVGDLECEEVVETHGLGQLVPQVAEPQQAVAERTTDRLGGFPGRAALVKVARLDQDPIDVVGRGGCLLVFATDREGEGILGGRLPGLGLGAGLDDLGDRTGSLGGAEPDLLELADLLVGDQRGRGSPDPARECSSRLRTVSMTCGEPT